MSCKFNFGFCIHFWLYEALFTLLSIVIIHHMFLPNLPSPGVKVLQCGFYKVTATAMGDFLARPCCSHAGLQFSWSLCLLFRSVAVFDVFAASAIG
jgi:hypothetical protein